MWLVDLPRANAVRVGAIYHKPSAVHSILGQSVRAVAHEYQFEGESIIGLGGGTCTLVSFDGRPFVVMTRHQLRLQPGVEVSESHFETIRFSTAVDGHLQNILVDRCFQELSNPNDAFHELLFFGVQKKWFETSADRPYFIPVEDFSGDPRRISFAYGHPISKNEVEYNPVHVYSRTAYIDVVLDEAYQRTERYLRRYVYPKKDYEVNGFSGGAVFSLFGSLEAGFRVALDGIVTTASGGLLHVVDADYLAEAMSRMSSL